MLERGVYLAPSQYEAGFMRLALYPRCISPISSYISLYLRHISPAQAGFMSLAHTEEDIDHTLAMAKEVIAII